MIRKSLLLRRKFLTGSLPGLTLSLASNLPTPCGYLRLKFVQFLYRRGITVAELGEVAEANSSDPRGAGGREREGGGCGDEADGQSRATHGDPP